MKVLSFSRRKYIRMLIIVRVYLEEVHVATTPSKDPWKKLFCQGFVFTTLQLHVHVYTFMAYCHFHVFSAMFYIGMIYYLSLNENL